jgi:hypothetical protein
MNAGAHPCYPGNQVDRPFHLILKSLNLSDHGFASKVTGLALLCVSVVNKLLGKTNHRGTEKSVRKPTFRAKLATT